jgi:hypothetical protein
MVKIFGQGVQACVFEFVCVRLCLATHALRHIVPVMCAIPLVHEWAMWQSWGEREK